MKCVNSTRTPTHSLYATQGKNDDLYLYNNPAYNILYYGKLVETRQLVRHTTRRFRQLDGPYNSTVDL